VISDINSWPIVDEYPESQLDGVFPISTRAACLMVRSKSNAVLSTNFINIQGAIEMMKGLDYHHDNLIGVVNQLAEFGLTGNKTALFAVLLHEAVAYMNRLGQFYYFSKSPFVQKICANSESLTPTIVKHIVFRQKHSAHRSIDDPRDESEHVQLTQAWSMSSISGHLFDPKPGQFRDISQLKTMQEIEEHARRIWKESYLVFQLITDDPKVFHNFSIEKEHPTIMQEAYAVLAQVLK
jgi:hypothetical protein